MGKFWRDLQKALAGSWTYAPTYQDAIADLRNPKKLAEWHRDGKVSYEIMTAADYLEYQLEKRQGK